MKRKFRKFVLVPILALSTLGLGCDSNDISKAELIIRSISYFTASGGLPVVGVAFSLIADILNILDQNSEETATAGPNDLGVTVWKQNSSGGLDEVASKAYGVPEIRASAGAPGSGAFVEPQLTINQAGFYLFGMKVDDGEVVDERDETNNEKDSRDVTFSNKAMGSAGLIEVLPNPNAQSLNISSEIVTFH